jgi:hypothetical protein
MVDQRLDQCGRIIDHRQSTLSLAKLNPQFPSTREGIAVVAERLNRALQFSHERSILQHRLRNLGLGHGIDFDEYRAAGSVYTADVDGVGSWLERHGDSGV